MSAEDKANLVLMREQIVDLQRKLLDERNRARRFKADVRKTVADYVRTEGCSCCEGSRHPEVKSRLGKLLGVPMFSDKSGYDFSKYWLAEG